jgi:hypothetical protein
MGREEKFVRTTNQVNPKLEHKKPEEKTSQNYREMREEATESF